MRLISFERSGLRGCGLLDPENGIHAVAGLDDLAALIARPDWRDAAKAALAAPAIATIDDPDIKLLPPITNPGKIFCVGLNYADHMQETGRAPVGHPTLFVRFPDSLVGHEAAIVCPKNSQEFDYEGELAVIIGKTCRHVAEQDALDAVLGYACFNDGSARDWQYHTSQFTPGKNFPASGGFGPWIVTADEIPNPQALRLQTRLNGQVVQESGTDKMIFSVARVIAYISGFTALRPGDVIATGTPAGVGSKRTPPLFMRPGDNVEVEISKIGTLRNRLAAE